MFYIYKGPRLIKDACRLQNKFLNYISGCPLSNVDFVNQMSTSPLLLSNFCDESLFFLSVVYFLKTKFSFCVCATSVMLAGVFIVNYYNKDFKVIINA